MRFIIITFFCFLQYAVFCQIPLSQLSASLQDSINGKFSKSDTTTLANGIRASVSNASGYYTITTLNSTTTLTNTSSEHLICFGTITVQLPTPSSCFDNGKTRRFIITKGDLGVSTLTITNESGSTISTTANKGTTYFFVSNGTSWIQCDRN